jgi:predicted nucleic acid-binding protein
MAKETIVNDVISSLNQTYLISSNVLTENEVFTSVNRTGESIRSNAPLQILRALSLIRVTTHSNRLISSLRTNYDLRASAPSKR